ncbi:unnamed protein product [Miscanthus lutarioriparius]|uniref:Uncharacterized protein n=1 Tax=Miscanthus lutarioriparius TaxID=422564 RepID=A0A811N525_9POAL|nr:unnamed protein product [Miscanthus lutarioriparius]
MARDSTCEASWEEAAFQWQRPRRPEEPGVRDVAVDPFSLRQFSRVDIDRPLPIPAVSVDDRRVSPARFHGASVSPVGSASSSPSPRASTAGDLKAPTAPTGWDGARPIAIAHSGALLRSKLSAGGETELADAGFDVPLSSTERNKAREPQRLGSDVPLIAAADAEEYSFGGYATKDARGKQAKHAGKAPFTCCMFVPGLTRRIIKPPTSTATATAAARSSSSGTFGKTASVQLQPVDPGTCSARPSTMSLAVSLERFDCGALSTSSSPRGLGLDDGDDPSASSYFDLPLELILGCDAEDDADLPVCAAFLFDSDGIRKSVLKRRLEAGAGWEPRRPSLGKVSMDASGRISNAQVRVSLKSRSP